MILGLGRFAGEGNSYPLQYSCLENSMDRGTWQATVHRVPKSWTWLNDFHFHFSVESSMAISLKNEHRNIHTLSCESVGSVVESVDIFQILN